MGGLFSKKNEGQQRQQPTLSVKDKAVLDLKVARDRLDKAKKKHEKEQEVYVAKAKELLKAKKKDQAKLALRLKKLRETQIEKISNQLFNLEKMVQDVQWAEHQTEIVQGMQAGTQALKELQKNLDADKVQEIMDESQEAMDRQREIDAVISESLNPEDEAAALEELEMIEKEEAGLLDAQLPKVPTGQVSTGEVQVETTSAEPKAEERQAVLA